MLTKRMFMRFAALCLAAPAAAQAQQDGPEADAATNEDSWKSLRKQFFGARPIGEAEGYIVLDAPTRAEEAALVPIDLLFPARGETGDRIKAVTVIVDENPVPLVTTLQRGRIDGEAFQFSTRIRVNSYSYVRAIAETESGALHMAKSFVKAAGGCSAPAGKDPEEALAHVGKMRFRSFAATGRDEAQVQIRHPNYSGMQMDQQTRLYTPAWYVVHVRVLQGDDLLFAMENGISLSEDPTFRFTYRANGAPVRVEAQDSRGTNFTGSFPANGDPPAKG
ncbi:quinoprotein dehydrogenase-associated SoxYZ-like carrier [Rhodoblastus sp.]|uniref:quinoprotein dehydrogenase-associated SoxYZ-like carrier n=1 Tax=Rhodoblastus sp. TaxID=1962975 RepID=UPI0035B4CF84